MIDLARRIDAGAVETVLDILTLLPGSFSPKKLSEANFADFLVYVLMRKGYVVDKVYINFTTKGFVLQ